MLHAAIIGDVVGSRFEFDRKGWSKDFELYTPECTFTDDTVMTLAVAKALMDAGKDAGESEIKTNCIKWMKTLGNRYPNAGYGAKFINWIFGESKPYGSYGNGSAMRVSPVGFMYDSIDRTREVARWTAEISHNHPEGIKGAEAVASAMFLSRSGYNKDQIREYVESEFGYDLSRSVDELRPYHEHIETCMDSIPKAFAAFLEGKDYEDVIRNAVSLGGDTDTLGAIAGAMAGAYYEIPWEILRPCNWYIDGTMKNIINDFNDMFRKE